MKNLKKVLALVLAVVMIMGTVAVASAKDYADIKADSDYAEAIDVLSNLNILDGFKTGETYNFQPDGYFTRAQAAKIVAIVHNAATNGKIKGQDAISSLYSNAQNPFVDCNNSWALPFINYCRITGLADGMTKTTYAPERRLTGVQWLKLMLTTLNFDTAKEGYTGTGWDINVLNRANEIGLLAGLPEGWKAIENVKRGEAAQILYNALTKYLVEYGQVIKNGKAFDKAFIANESVSASGFTLAAKMGVGLKRSTDAFRRPGYTWSYGSWNKFYMDKPVNSYTTAVTMCDILKNDMKVPETSKKEVVLNGYRKGVDPTANVATTTGLMFADAGTALNYYAVDGYKYVNVIDGEQMVLQHETDKSCQLDTSLIEFSWDAHVFGGQGDLTQVFETEDGWVITTVHTFLANVEKVNKNNKYSHATAESAEIKVYLEMENDVPSYVEKRVPAWGANAGVFQMKTVGTTEYAVGTKLLVNLTLKKDEQTNYTQYYSYNSTDTAQAILVGAADSKTGKLTGASDITYPETVSIDGTKYNTNCRFVLGKDDAMNIANNGKTYTFYFDTYGNVIGRVDEVMTTAASYVVLDRIYGVHENGKFALKGDMHDMEGNAIEGAPIAVAGSFATAKDGYDNFGSYSPAYNYPTDHFIYMVAAHNDSDLVNALYSYKKSDAGVYTLTWVGQATTSVNSAIAADGTDVAFGIPYGKVEGKLSHAAKLAYISVMEYGSNFNYTGKAMNVANTVVDNEIVSRYELSLSESTKFVVKSAGGEYKTYTGYTALPALTASAIDYVDVDNDGFADVVFIVGAVYAADSITGWVLKWTPFNWANGYDLITVYVDGEPVTVNVKHSTIVTGVDAEGNPLARGLYTFETKVDADGVTYSEVYKVKENVNTFSAIAAADASADSTAIKVIRKNPMTGAEYETTIGLTDVVIYNVLADGTVVKADASCIATGDQIIYVGGQPFSFIYVVDKTIPYI